MDTTPFSFRTVPALEFGIGSCGRLGPLTQARFGRGRVLIVTDAGVMEHGLADGAIASLKAAGFAVDIAADVVADPPEDVVRALGDQARAADLVIGFGGGSSMDAAKLAAVLASGTQALETMYGLDAVTAKRPPLILVPTTAGTGSEVTAIAIVTTNDGQKMGVVDPALYADLAVLDPALTVTKPAAVTAATGVDAMVHAIEAFTSAHKKNPLSDLLALGALTRLFRAVPAAVADGANLAARSDALFGAMLAGQAFANAPVAAVHALAYPLGARFHLPHGLSNAVVLPEVLAFNAEAPAATEAYASLHTHLTGDGTGSAEARAARFVEAMTQMCADLGLRRPLREFGVSHNNLPELADDAMLQTRLLQNNPRPLGRDDALRIYDAVW